MDIEQIGMCGAYCGVCEWKEKTSCPGCQASKGNLFWGECAVAKCCLKRASATAAFARSFRATFYSSSSTTQSTAITANVWPI